MVVQRQVNARPFNRVWHGSKRPHETQPSILDIPPPTVHGICEWRWAKILADERVCGNLCGHVDVAAILHTHTHRDDGAGAVDRRDVVA